MATQDECIKALTETPKYDLYYGKKSIKNLLTDIKAFGEIKKYAVWKKIFNHLTSSSYCNLKSKHGKKEIKLLLDLMDDKLVINKNDYNKLMNILHYNTSYQNISYTDIYKLLCERFGICNVQHLSDLLNIHKINKINKLNIYIIDFINIKYKEKDYITNTIKFNIFMDIIMDKDLCNSVFTSKNIMNFIKTLEYELDDMLYNTYELNFYINEILQNNIETNTKKNKETKGKKSKVIYIEENNDNEIGIVNKLNQEQLNEYIKDIVEKYFNYSNIFLNTFIDNINNKDNKDNKNTDNKKLIKPKKSKKDDDTDDDTDDDSDNTDEEKEVDKINNNEITYIDIYHLLYNTKFYIDLKCDEKYIWYKYFNTTNFEKFKSECENKLKQKLTFLNLSNFNEIDDLNSHNDSDYNYYVSDIESINKLDDIFYYELDESDAYEENEECIYLAKRKITFAKYMLNLYGDNREFLNDKNVDNFIILKYPTEFIDLNNSENKKFVKIIIDNKVLSGKSFDYKILAVIDFDEITMKNALLRKNINLIKYLLNNKYSPTQNDFMYIRTKIAGKEDKTSYRDTFEQDLKPILEQFAIYNMYMDKDTFIKFCYNNVFHLKFNLKLLKDYTIYKNESDKEFNEIIDEIKQNKLYMTNYDKSNDTVSDIEEYINKYITNKTTKLTDTKDIKDHMYLYADLDMRYMLDEIFKRYELVKKTTNNVVVSPSEERPKKIIKKIIKKIVKKKVVESAKE
jgi:hypothetical protein